MFNDLMLNDDQDILIEDSDIVFSDSVAQKIVIRLKWFLHEWKFNPTFGIPYFSDVFVKNPDMDYISGILKEHILKDEEVSDILLFTSSLSNDRVLHISFKVKTKTDNSAEGSVNISV